MESAPFFITAPQTLNVNSELYYTPETTGGATKNLSHGKSVHSTWLVFSNRFNPEQVDLIPPTLSEKLENSPCRSITGHAHQLPGTWWPFLGLELQFPWKMIALFNIQHQESSFPGQLFFFGQFQDIITSIWPEGNPTILLIRQTFHGMMIWIECSKLSGSYSTRPSKDLPIWKHKNTKALGVLREHFIYTPKFTANKQFIHVVLHVKAVSTGCPLGVWCTTGNNLSTENPEQNKMAADDIG